MKKVKFLTVISALALLTGCGGSKEEFSEDWTTDDDYHWHASLTDGSEETSGLAKHEFDAPYVKDNREVKACKICHKEVEVDHTKEFQVIEIGGNPFEIHTDEQKGFLEYDGDYATMPSNAYPDGVLSLSDPNKGLVSWNYAYHDENVIYSISISQNPDMSDAFEIKGTNSKSMEAYNFYLGDNYYRINATRNNVKYSSSICHLVVDDVAPRNLYVGEKMTNCRDSGGRVTEQGSKVKQGLLYRTCGSDYGMTENFIDDEGKKILFDELGIKTEINVNNGTNYNFGTIDGVTVYDTFCDYADTQSHAKHHFSRNTESVKNVFEILSKRENYPIAYHCRIGTDRTGLIAILVNGVLGVSINEIYQDYLFSNFGAIGKKRYIGELAKDDNIQKYMEEIQAMPGDNFQEKTYNALLAIGVPAETIEKVKDILLEGEKPDNNYGQIVKGVEEMELAGTEVISAPKETLTERETPAYYAELSTGAKVRFEFTTATAGTKQVYAYLGHMDNSTSNKISGAISVEVDNKSVSVPDITFADAGMGNCASRVNYYFVKIGELTNLDVGAHSICITGINFTMSIGLVSIF